MCTLLLLLTPRTPLPLLLMLLLHVIPLRRPRKGNPLLLLLLLLPDFSAPSSASKNAPGPRKEDLVAL
jgi:hypothetical protein